MKNKPLKELNTTQLNYNHCAYIPKLAHAYVPFQYMTCIYPPLKGLDHGTIFPELDSPYGTNPEYTIDQ